MKEMSGRMTNGLVWAALIDKERRKEAPPDVPGPDGLPVFIAGAFAVTVRRRTNREQPLPSPAASRRFKKRTSTRRNRGAT
jgi:hypothetical protein